LVIKVRNGQGKISSARSTVQEPQQFVGGHIKCLTLSFSRTQSDEDYEIKMSDQKHEYPDLLGDSLSNQNFPQSPHDYIRSLPGL